MSAPWHGALSLENLAPTTPSGRVSAEALGRELAAGVPHAQRLSVMIERARAP